MNKLILMMHIQILTFFLTTLNSCQGQGKKEKDCNEYYRLANSSMSSFYLKRDTGQIITGLKNLDLFFNCEKKINPNHINLKITFLTLLKQYKTAYEFIASTSEEDYKYRYQKMMYYNFLKGQYFSSINDSANATESYKLAEKSIYQFLKTREEKSEDLESILYDLVLVRKTYYGKTEFEAQIDNLKLEFPSKSEFLNNIVTSLSESENVSRPIEKIH